MAFRTRRAKAAFLAGARLQRLSPGRPVARRAFRVAIRVIDPAGLSRTLGDGVLRAGILRVRALRAGTTALIGAMP